MRTAGIIGLKYCGGCNPYYDREAEVKKLQLRCEGVEFEAYRTERAYAKIFLICGCPRTCIRNKEIFKGKDCVVLKCPEDFLEIESEIKQWQEKSF